MLSACQVEVMLRSCLLMREYEQNSFAQHLRECMQEEGMSAAAFEDLVPDSVVREAIEDGFYEKMMEYVESMPATRTADLIRDAKTRNEGARNRSDSKQKSKKKDDEGIKIPRTMEWQLANIRRHQETLKAGGSMPPPPDPAKRGGFFKEASEY